MKDISKIIDLYVNKRLSIPEVSKELSIPRSTIRYWLHKNGLCRSRKEFIEIALPKYGVHARGKKRIFTDEWKKNIGKAKKGKGRGISLKPSGYIEITMGVNKSKRLHRVIIEKEIGRKLQKNEVVHHINGIKTDNNINNLQILSLSEHARFHAIERISNGTNFDISKIDTKGEKHPMVKLTNKIVNSIRKRYNPSIKNQISSFALEYGVSKSCIKHIIKNRSWKSLKLK